MTIVATAAYALAGLSDLRTRRVPNLLWVILLVYLLWSGVTVAGVLGAVLLGAVSLFVWWRGEMGGADVKGLTLLPLAFPEGWPVAVALGLLVASAWLVVESRDEVPMFVPMFAGVLVAALVA